MEEIKKWEYHEICMWCPYKPETVVDIAKDMAQNGYRQDRPIVLYEGKILDGRHRYDAALKTGTEFTVVEFEGSWADAVKYVASENINRRHMTSVEKEFFYVQLANVTGVRARGAPEGNQNRLGGTSNPKNFGINPSAKEHADSLGVTSRTVENWEADRRVVFSDPELAAKATTAEAYREVKRELRKATKEEADKILKLKDLGERSDAESGNVERMLDKYSKQGIDVDAVRSQGQIEKTREAYWEARRPREELSMTLAKILVDAKDYETVAAVLQAAYHRPGELEKAYEILEEEHRK